MFSGGGKAQVEHLASHIDGPFKLQIKLYDGGKTI